MIQEGREERERLVVDFDTAREDAARWQGEADRWRASWLDPREDVIRVQSAVRIAMAEAETAIARAAAAEARLDKLLEAQAKVPKRRRWWPL